jgi:Asp-tRNA(Asn)/Glu-tRNA(Gln) amidotransferase A subunit family amidase
MTHRRELLAALSSLGVGTLPFQRSLAASLQDAAKPTVTPKMIAEAEWVAGITLTDEQRKSVASAMTASLRGAKDGHAIPVPYDVPPAFHFACPPAAEGPTGRGTVAVPEGKVAKPEKDDDLAFLPAWKLAQLLAAKHVSSVDLAKLFLGRLHALDEKLKCVVTFTDDLAMAQAKRADEERAKGTVRGPLHGIPWGAKDLIAVPGYPTTWGAAHFKNQTLTDTATVAKRLESQGMVLVAKLTLGALAWGDQWFGGRTNNPWDVSRGSSGSSAGSASAVAAGCVPVAVGSETLGSIISPSRECGVTGLRPTFGRVSRAGCMTLSWTMDKLGPMARCVDDCALMLAAMHGHDPADAASVTRPFAWPGTKPLKDLKVGFFEAAASPTSKSALKVLGDMGVTLVPVKLPSRVPNSALSTILTCEAAAAFDDLTRAGISEGIGNWPTTFREGRFVSAVNYIRANRLRTLVMNDMAKLMETVDLYVGGNDLQITNLTGHPSICLPAGFTTVNGKSRPQPLTFTGRLFGETDMLAIAKAFQDATGHHLKRPTLAS